MSTSFNYYSYQKIKMSTFRSVKEPSISFQKEGILATSTSFRVLLISDINHMELESNVWTTRLWYHIRKSKNSMIFVTTQVDYRKRKGTVKGIIHQSLILMRFRFMMLFSIYFLHFSLYIIFFSRRIVFYLFLMVWDDIEC